MRGGGPAEGHQLQLPAAPRRDVEVNVSGYPAPPKIGTQMYAQGTINKMITACTQQGKLIEQAMAVAEHDIEGFMRS